MKARVYKDRRFDPPYFADQLASLISIISHFKEILWQREHKKDRHLMGILQVPLVYVYLLELVKEKLEI